MTDELMSIIAKLNRQDLLPPLWARRNSVYFKLVSYINHTIALSISESYDDVALFINRANKEIKSLIANNYIHEDYFSLCNEYLRLITKYMIDNALLSAEGISLLPQDIFRIDK